MTNEDLEQLFFEGRLALIKEHEKKEVKKLGNLRGGSCGIIEETATSGKVYGECLRKAHLRQIGIDLKPELSTYNIFDEGIYNEDMQYDLLKNSSWEGTILREEEIPVIWALDNGTKITGRPDIVFCNQDKKPLHGIELKKKLSYGGVLKSFLNLKPDSGHLIQAAHYSIKLGEQYGDGTPLPYTLMYTNGTVFALKGERQGDVRDCAHPTPEKFVEYSWGKPFRIIPSSIYYSLTWEDGYLYYHADGMKKPQRTIITKEAIEDYFKVVDAIQRNKRLGPRPTSSHVGVKVKGEKWNSCGFCPLKETCDSYEQNYDEWLDHVVIKARDMDWTTDDMA